MTDITKIQAYEIPPEINMLKDKNMQLTNKNKYLLKQANIVISVIAFSTLALGILIYYKIKLYLCKTLSTFFNISIRSKLYGLIALDASSKVIHLILLTSLF